MDNHRVFKFLWRANAVIIFVVAILIACLTVLMLGIAIAESGSYDVPPPIADVSAQDNESAANLQLNFPYSNETVGNYTYIELQLEGNSGGSGLKSYVKSQIRNIAVFDLKANITTWVFEDSQQEIETYEPIKDRSPDGAEGLKGVTKGFLLTVATSRADKTIVKDIWIMSPDGLDARKIISDVSDRLQIKYYGETEVKLLIKKDDKVDIYPLNVDTLTLGEVFTVTTP